MDKVINVGKHMAEAALRYPERVGLVKGGQSWTWLELNSRVDAYAAGLAGVGVRKGSVAFKMTPNNVAAYETIFSSAKLGAIDVPLNFRATPAEVMEYADACRPQVFTVHEDSIACAEAALQVVPELQVVVIGAVPAEKRIAGWRSYEEVIAANLGAVVPAVKVSHGDHWQIGFSSGSTGKPKASIATFGQIAYTIVNRLADVMVGLTPDDGFLAIGPLSHGSGTVVNINTARAAKIVMLSTPSFNEGECWDLIEEHHITTLFLVPNMLMRLIRHPSFKDRDISSLKHVVYAGAPISRPDQKEAIRALGPALVQYYGSGESLGHGTVLRPEMHTLDDNDPHIPIGTIGVPRTGTDLEIMSEDLQPLPVGEAGQLCIRRGPGVFGGYYGPDAEAANAEVFKGDWLLTGDIAKRDERGFVFILGRSKDMYKSGGLQVFPNETENCLAKHPAVAEAYVIPFDDSEWGQVGVAVVTLHASHAVTEDELKAHLRKYIAGYKLPKRIFIWEDIERAASGKVLKPKVKEAIYARGLAIQGQDIR